MLKKRNTILQAFREVIEVSKPLFLGNYFLTFLQGILNAAPIWCLQVFLDAIIGTEQTGDWAKVWGSLLIYVLVHVAYYVVKGITDYQYEYYDLLVGQRMLQKTNSKISTLAPIAFEEAGSLDGIEKAYRGTSRIRDIVDTIMMTALYYIPEVLVVVLYLYSANPVLPVIVFFIICVVVAAEKIQSKFFSELESQIAHLTRKIDRFSEYICSLNYYKETKILGLQNYFVGEIKELFSKKQQVEWKFFRKSIFAGFAEKGISALSHIVILVILFVCTWKGSITVGVFAALVTSLGEMFTMIDDLIGHLSGGISESLGKAQNYFALQDIQETVCSEEAPAVIESITLKNVDFSYPNQQQKAVRNVSITIRKGEHIAVVGENGSGKSTLIKLIAGLYLPTNGEIYINDKNIRDIPKAELQHNMSAIFQTFGKYQMTIRDNVAISDPKQDKETGEILDRMDFFSGTGTHLDEDTLLSREFGGTDISGGQWQRLAMARGFYRDRNLIFMDEPTSAIDPIEEGRVLGLLQQLSSQKTSIVVTHRLGSIKYADKILVMKEGTVMGFGTHRELLAQCREYQKIWEAQAQFYHDIPG